MLITVAWTVLSLLGLILAIRCLQDCRADEVAMRRGEAYEDGGLQDVVAQGNVRRMGARVVLFALFLVVGVVVLTGWGQLTRLVFPAALLASNVATVYGTAMDRLDRRRLVAIAAAEAAQARTQGGGKQ